MWILPVFLVGFAVAYWLLLCGSSWSVTGEWEFYPGQRRRRAERRRCHAVSPAPPERAVTLCGCNSCMRRRQ